MSATFRGRALGRGLALIACAAMISAAEAKIIRQPTAKPTISSQQPAIADPPALLGHPVTFDYFASPYQPSIAVPWVVVVEPHNIWRDLIEMKAGAWNPNHSQVRVQNATFFRPIPLNAFRSEFRFQEPLRATQGFGSLGWHRR